MVAKEQTTKGKQQPSAKPKTNVEVEKGTGEKAASDAEDSGPRLHKRVTCDCCETNPIKGIRFKCLVCDDYDLCSQCEAKQIHKEHAMIRIADPNDNSWKVSASH